MNPIPLFKPPYQWLDAKALVNRSFTCGYCSNLVSSVKGFGVRQQSQGHEPNLGIYLCPNCLGPNLFTPESPQFPSPAFGNPVRHVPQSLNALYEEARRCTTTNCHTAAVLLCRKMLMNIAVEQGAKAGLNFTEYVDFLSEKGYVPPKGKHWVDHIRKKGNEATHEIALMKDTDAKELLTFIE